MPTIGLNKILGWEISGDSRSQVLATSRILIYSWGKLAEASLTLAEASNNHMVLRELAPSGGPMDSKGKVREASLALAEASGKKILAVLLRILAALRELTPASGAVLVASQEFPALGRVHV